MDIYIRISIYGREEHHLADRCADRIADPRLQANLYSPYNQTSSAIQPNLFSLHNLDLDASMA